MRPFYHCQKLFAKEAKGPGLRGLLDSLNPTLLTHLGSNLQDSSKLVGRSENLVAKRCGFQFIALPEHFTASLSLDHKPQTWLVR